MIEYKDGQFGTIAPSEAVLELLQKAPLENIKAVHFGTYKELMGIRLNKENFHDLHLRMEELERTLEAMQPKGMVKVFQMEDVPKV